MRNVSEVVGVIVMFIGAIFVMAMILAIPTMLLWDWLMPTIFGLPEITLFQAFGINLLSGILFKNNTSSN